MYYIVEIIDYNREKRVSTVLDEKQLTELTRLAEDNDKVVISNLSCLEYETYSELKESILESVEENGKKLRS